VKGGHGKFAKESLEIFPYQHCGEGAEEKTDQKKGMSAGGRKPDRRREHQRPPRVLKVRWGGSKSIEGKSQGRGFSEKNRI